MTIRPMASLTFFAHLYKAIFRNYHHEMVAPLRMLLTQNSVIFDVGAHAGQYSKMFVRLFPKSHIYAFEPASYTYIILAIVHLLRGWKNVMLVKKGLGHREAILTLSIPIKKSGSFGFGLSHLGHREAHKTYFSEDISITTCDAFVAEQNVKAVDFIKIDIEGSETDMLKGAEHTLSTYRPMLLIEMNDIALQRCGSSYVELWEFLAVRQYTPLLFNESNHAFEQTSTGVDSIDIFWIPAEKIDAIRH